MKLKPFGIFLSSLLCASSVMVPSSFADGIHNFSIRHSSTPVVNAAPALNQGAVAKPDPDQSTINELDKFAPPPPPKPKSFTYVTGRIVVVDVHNDAGRISRIFPRVGPAPTANDFIKLVGRSVKGSRVDFDDNFSFLFDSNNHLVNPVTFSSTSGGSCFNMRSGDQQSLTTGFSGVVVDGNSGLWNIVIDQMFRSDLLRCEPSKNHMVFTIDPKSSHGMVPFDYDARSHSQKILYIGFEKRRSVKANR